MSISKLLFEHTAVKWKPVRDGFGWAYESTVGIARWVSVLTPRYDGDDGTSQSRLYIYFYEQGKPARLILTGKTHIE